MHLVQILCDESENCEADAGGAWLGANVSRQVAASRGWTQREVDGELLDFCPEHS